MRVEKIVLRERLFESGNECLRYSIELPRIEGREVINSFYSQIGAECEDFCKQKLFERIRNESRGLHRYSFSFRVTHNDGEILSMVFSAKLRFGGLEIARSDFAANWSVFDEQMIPSSLLCKKYGMKRIAKKTRIELFLDRGKLRILKNGEEADFMSK